MHHHVRNALLAAAASAGGLGAAAPAAAATTFVSAEATAYAQAGVVFSPDVPPPPVTRSDFSSTARRLQAEAQVAAGSIGADLSSSTASAVADFAPDGSQGMLSVGYRNAAGAFGPFGDGFATAEVRYTFVYRFDIDATSRFIGDWTVGFPEDVTIALAGPSVLAGPLPAAFGNHSLLLRPGSYELTFSARDFSSSDQPGYYIGTMHPVPLETSGFDIYSFQIIESVSPPIPEPGTGSLAALGAGVLGMAVCRRRRRNAGA